MSMANSIKRISEFAQSAIKKISNPEAYAAKQKADVLLKDLPATNFRRLDEEDVRTMGLKKGGAVKSSASKRADGIAQRGKTRGKYI